MLQKTVVLLACYAGVSSANMNGPYLVSTAGKGPINSFNTDYESKGYQYFDVWAVSQ
jgi:hypothetical protein